jgi:exonuclease VII small subunit
MAETLDQIVQTFNKSAKELGEAAKAFQDADAAVDAEDKKLKQIMTRLVDNPDDNDLRNRRDKSVEKLRRLKKKRDDARDDLAKAAKAFAEAQNKFFMRMLSLATK